MKKSLVYVGMLVLMTALVLAYVCSDADFDGDGYVGPADYAIFGSWYGTQNCSVNNSYCNGTDINEDGYVGVADHAIFAGLYGMNCTNSTNGTCI
ncbi:hypothetical protein JW868_02185 [Candidatus Woesearchaeota archaeon]|nr:hypothetical protein [Candidatus Woesearchaeota archaeon]